MDNSIIFTGPNLININATKHHHFEIILWTDNNNKHQFYCYCKNKQRICIYIYYYTYYD